MNDICCLWQGSKSFEGYGQIGFKINDKWTTCSAHKISFYMFNNKESFVCRHKCRNRNCVNPLH